MTMLVHEVKERLVHCCDPESFIDILEISMEQLMDAFEDEMMDNLDKIDNAFDIYGEQYDEFS